MTALCNVAVRRNRGPVQFTGSVTQYSYGPFGELIRATGPVAKLNPFRFSTKYQDDETDLVYYGYRYYNASTGRWLSRDPIEEPGFILLTTGEYIGDDGGLNLYAFVGNNALFFYDLNGLALETGWDAFNVSLGVVSLGCNISSGNIIGALVDGGGLLYDAAATAIPILPGGAGTAIRLYRGGRLAPKMYRFLEASKTAKNVYRYGVREGVDEAHHILPHRGANSQWLKGQLRKDMDVLRARADKAGFDLIDAANGAALPKEFHGKLDSTAYYERVLAEFKGATTKNDFERAADNLAEQLLKESGKIK